MPTIDARLRYAGRRLGAVRRRWGRRQRARGGAWSCVGRSATGSPCSTRRGTQARSRWLTSNFFTATLTRQEAPSRDYRTQPRVHRGPRHRRRRTSRCARAGTPTCALPMYRKGQVLSPGTAMSMGAGHVAVLGSPSPAQTKETWRRPMGRSGDSPRVSYARLAVMQAIFERTGGRWTPGRGRSIHLHSLEDEGLVTITEHDGRRVAVLTPRGRSSAVAMQASAMAPWHEPRPGGVSVRCGRSWNR